jgi:glycosyltransferase involved in cell wall biosynthesis
VAAGKSPLNGNYRMIVPNRYPGVNHRVHEILRREQPDLIEICDKYSLHYAAGLIRRGWLPGLEKRPVLVGLSCERMDDNLSTYLSRGSLGQAFARFYMKWIYFGFFDHHITVSPYTVEELRIAGRGHIVERGIWVRPMGADLAMFDASRRRPSPGGTVRLLYAGRLAPEKNLDLLFAALRLLPECYELTVAGDGIERARLQALGTPRAKFVGHLPNREALADLYATSDIFVHPNPREPFGIAPIEAMASGLALVAPRAGGVLTYAGDSNAWLAEPSPEAFAAAIERCSNDPDREQKVLRSIVTARQFDLPASANRYLDLHESLVRGGVREQADFVSTPGTWFGQEV